jgi:hypothetical protein
MRSLTSSGASPVRITTMRSSGSFATAGSAHWTAWPVPRCSGWSAMSTLPVPKLASSAAFTTSCW